MSRVMCVSTDMISADKEYSFQVIYSTLELTMLKFSSENHYLVSDFPGKI